MTAHRIGYSRGEAADAIGVSTDTIDRWIADGTLIAYRIGTRTIRIKPEDLETAMRPVPSVATFNAGLV